MLEQLELKLKTIAGGKVLDTATGGGDFIGFIKEFQSYDSITAIDSESRMGDIIKKNFPEDKIEFITMDAANPQFAPESFYTICVSNSLHHFQNPALVLQKLKAILKPDGLFVINEMRCDQLSPAQQSHDQVHRFWAELDQKRGVVHNHTFSKSQIEKLVSELDLKELEVFEYCFPIDQAASTAQVERLEKMLATFPPQLADDPDLPKLQVERDSIIEYMKIHGFAPAAAIMLIGRKG